MSSDEDRDQPAEPRAEELAQAASPTLLPPQEATAVLLVLLRAYKAVVVADVVDNERECSSSAAGSRPLAEPVARLGLRDGVPRGVGPLLNATMLQNGGMIHVGLTETR